MCTLTYFPGSDRVILTSNRDESPLRPFALEPQIFEEGGKKICYPRDPLGGGSWIMCRSNGNMACLLNGAFQRHRYAPPYRMSRGLVLKQTMLAENALRYISKTELSHIEPFNLVFIPGGEPHLIFELRWDGKRRHLRYFDPEKPAIWASASLYQPQNIRKRVLWFQKWLEENDHSAESLLQFHEHAGDGDSENDLVMDRKGSVQTVSISQFIRNNSTMEVIYQDLLNKKNSEIQFELES